QICTRQLDPQPCGGSRERHSKQKIYDLKALKVPIYRRPDNGRDRQGHYCQHETQPVIALDRHSCSLINARRSLTCILLLGAVCRARGSKLESGRRCDPCHAPERRRSTLCQAKIQQPVCHFGVSIFAIYLKTKWRRVRLEPRENQSI